MSWLFYCTLGFLLTHELDAVQKKEWRLLPGLNRLGDKWGYRAFVWLHVPLIALCFLYVNHHTFQCWMSGFCVIHVFAHILFIKNPKYLFEDRWSWGLIVGAGVCGATFLGETLRVGISQ